MTMQEAKARLTDAGARRYNGTDVDTYDLGRWTFRFERDGEWTRAGDWSVRYYGTLQGMGGRDEADELARMVERAVGSAS